MDGDDRGKLLDYHELARWLATAALVLGGGAFTGVVVQGVLQGLRFRLMARWLALFVVAFLVTAALLTAFHALRGAYRARARGKRLGGDDIGFLPRRPPEDDD